MTIRIATVADVPRIVELGGQMHAESQRWSRIPYDPERAAESLSRLIRVTGVVFLCERDGLIVGGIAGVMDKHWACDAVIAQEVAFFVDREYRGGMAASRLICALVAWGKLKGAAWLHAGTSTGLDPEMVAALYQRLGFECCSIGLEYHYG
ncbi:GNAT family N-acetyltransferase [Cupriavidus sp. EM10]|uniref:GNAT family N-acetyltransferase n=1 Tax=Cupriavidus sp. EM10 TaxID=2839983 RepID=UPI001C0051CB|nr:GNAT family N-acetyltransferase [Cupriavidus sp. EM10]QWE95654.1 GNAT family N-acetyltransferase [Cupriavidus sp. EM10]